MALADVLRNLALIGAQGGSALGNALQAQGNPIAFQQAQEAQRQHEQILAQLQLHNSLTPYEQGQLQLQQQSQQEQAGRDVWAAISQGASLTPSGSEPDFYVGGRGFNLPSADSGYAISPDEPMGKYYGITSPVSGLSADQYLKAHGQFAADQQAQKDATASRAILDTQKQQARLWLTHRFSPQYATTLYGQADPTATLESQNLANELEAIPDLKSMATWQDKARAYTTQWEQLQQKRLELKQQLALRAADASTKDPHLTSTVLAQSRSLDELEKPVEQEWATGNDIIALANQRTPAADSQLITAMMPYITNVKRFNQSEIQNAQGGATAWTNIQRTLNKFASDPYHAQIPDVQRAQIVSILQQKQSNLKALLDKVNDTRDDIAGMDQSADVLKRVARLHRDISTYQQSAAPQGAQSGKPDWVVVNGRVVRNQ